MNKKDQKAKEPNDKQQQKADEAKTEKSVEKTSNNINNKKEKNNISNSITEAQPQPNTKNPNIKKENGILKNNNNVTNNSSNEKNHIKKEQEPTPEDHQNAHAFLQYIDESGLPEAFQLIFAELIAKKINTQNYFSYVGMRLRQIGKEINDLQNI